MTRAAVQASYRHLVARYPGVAAGLTEDGGEGVTTWTVDGTVVSRDLLDSISEIGFLDQAISDLKIRGLVDIGSGYGRLASRFREWGHQGRYVCTDAVEESLVICSLYLDRCRVRDVEKCRAAEVTRQTLKGVSVALGVHSFPEMTRAQVRSWLNIIADSGVEYLFLVPNEMGDCRTTENDGRREPFDDDLGEFGYVAVAETLKYPSDASPIGWVYQDEQRLYQLSGPGCLPAAGDGPR